MFKNFYTTQIGRGRKLIEKRFRAVRRSGHSKKSVKMLGIFAAVCMAFSSIFASAALADSAEVYQTSGIEVVFGGVPSPLWNQPFADNGEIYIPLRETLNLCGVDNSNIEYDNGAISLNLYSPTTQDNVKVHLTVGESGVLFDLDANNYAVYPTGGKRSTSHPVLIKNGVTYAPIGAFIRIKDLDIKNTSPKSPDGKYSRALKLNLLSLLEVRNYGADGKFTAVLSSPFNTDGAVKYNPENYYSKGENVFIGTAQQQEAYGYHYTDINGYHYPADAVKRILVDQNGKVLAVVPADYQKHEMLDRVNSDTYLGTFGWDGMNSSSVDGMTTGVMICDPETAIASAASRPCFFIPVENIIL